MRRSTLRAWMRYWALVTVICLFMVPLSWIGGYGLEYSLLLCIVLAGNAVPAFLYWWQTR